MTKTHKHSDAVGPTGVLVGAHERDTAVQRLTDAFAGDVLDVEEFEKRLERVQVARTETDLAVLVDDLPQVVPPTHAMTRVSASAANAPQKMLTLFGSIERDGAWAVAPKTRSKTLFGSTELDFRQAVFGAEICEVHVVAWFGSVEIIVPPEVQVEVAVSPIFGSVEVLRSGQRRAGGPQLRIVGTVAFGSVEVSTRRPGESRRQAAKRYKAEQKALRARNDDDR